MNEKVKCFNINNFVRVMLTDYGKVLYYHFYEQYGLPTWPKIDENGFTEFQLHEFMNIYGPHLVVGGQQIIENNEIYFKEGDLVDGYI